MFITILFNSYYENIELTLYFLIIFIHILLWVFCYINVREYRRAIKMDKNGYILVLLLFVMILMFNLIKDWSFNYLSSLHCNCFNIPFCNHWAISNIIILSIQIRT
jgi:hypothetical protein